MWVSDAKMGDVPSQFVLGNRYYICYELIDETTGKIANETSNINYKAITTGFLVYVIKRIHIQEQLQ